MTDLLKFPTPIKEIWEARAAGQGGIILEENTTDRIMCGSAGLEHPMSIKYAIYYAFGLIDYHIGQVNITDGFTNKKPGQKWPFPIPKGALEQNPAAFIKQFTQFLQSKEHKILLLIDGADLLLPETETGMMSPDQLHLLNVLIDLGLNDGFQQTENILVLKSLQGNVNRALSRSGAFPRVSVPLPDEDMRREFLIFLSKHSKYSKTIPANIGIDELARLTNGTRLKNIEELAKKCYSENLVITREDINVIKSEAIKNISQGQLGIIIPKRSIDDIVGCENLKRFLRYQVMLARAGSKSMPSMIILMGVPGVGKSFSIEAYASELGWELLEWKNVRSQWVGQSEARTEQALEIIEQNSPCLVWVDEGDQILGGRSVNAGDSGVDARIFGQILAATGDSKLRGKVQWLIATNRPDIMDPALLDRAGQKIVFLTPSLKDRIQLLSHLAKQQGRELEKDVDIDSLANEPNLAMASVRNLIEIIGKAAEYADMEKKDLNSSIAHKHLYRAVQEFNTGDTLETEFIGLHCLNHLRFNSQLPWINDNGELIPGYDFPPYLKNIVHSQTGLLNREELIKRLRNIEEIRARQKIMR